MNISNNIPCPCKDCKDRWINVETCERCHATCEKYIEYKNQTKEIWSKQIEEKSMDKFCKELKKNQRGKTNSIRSNKARKQLYKTL